VPSSNVLSASWTFNFRVNNRISSQSCEKHHHLREAWAFKRRCRYIG